MNLSSTTTIFSFSFLKRAFADETFEDYDIVFDEKEQADSLLLNSDGYIQKGKTVPFLRDSDRFALNYEPFEKIMLKFCIIVLY